MIDWECYGTRSFRADSHWTSVPTLWIIVCKNGKATEQFVGTSYLPKMWEDLGVSQQTSASGRRYWDQNLEKIMWHIMHAVTDTNHYSCSHWTFHLPVQHSFLFSTPKLFPVTMFYTQDTISYTHDPLHPVPISLMHIQSDLLRSPLDCFSSQLYHCIVLMHIQPLPY